MAVHKSARHATLALAGLAVSLSLTACGAGAGHASGPTADRNASALRLIQQPTPPLGVRRYVTKGTYPQVSGGGLDLQRVNAALRNSVRADQKSYARRARRHLRESPSPPEYGPGLYETSPKRGLTSASTTVISSLIAVTRLFPGGNDGDAWISVTVRVPAGSPITIGELFSDPSKGLAALASAVRNRLLASNRCVRESVKDSLVGDLYLRRLAPTPRNYQHFALTAQGLAVGFDIGDVGAPPCGRVTTTVPYATVRPYLSELGIQLVAGVRQPRT